MAVATTANTQHLTRTTNIGIVGHGRITLLGWANYTSAVNGAVLICAEHTSNGRSIGLQNTGSGLFAIGDNEGETTFAQTPALNQWFYFAVTTTAAGGPMFGYWSPLGSDRWWRVSQTNSTEGSVQAERVSLFTIETTAANWRGRMEHVMAFNRTLTFDEIRLQKRQTMPVSYAQLWGWWPLASVVNQVVDMSGNHRNLTATGTLSTHQGTRLPVLALDERRSWMAETLAGRASKNIRSHPLGINVGMGIGYGGSA